MGHPLIFKTFISHTFEEIIFFRTFIELEVIKLLERFKILIFGLKF